MGRRYSGRGRRSSRRNRIVFDPEQEMGRDQHRFDCYGKSFFKGFAIALDTGRQLDQLVDFLWCDWPAIGQPCQAVDDLASATCFVMPVEMAAEVDALQAFGRWSGDLCVGAADFECVDSSAIGREDLGSAGFDSLFDLGDLFRREVGRWHKIAGLWCRPG